MRTFFFLFLSMFSLNSFSQKVISLNFSEKDYSCTINNNLLLISSNVPDTRMFGDDTYPYLPYIPCRIIIPEGITSTKYNLTFEKSLIYNGCSVAANPKPVSRKKQTISQKVMASDISMMSPVQNGGVIQQENYKYLFLKVTPFLYDSNKKEVYFISNITITFPEWGNSLTSSSETHGQFEENLKKRFLNIEDLPYNNNIRSQNSWSTDIDYLIITVPTLVSSFETLKQWKNKKAVSVAIETMATMSANPLFASNSPRLMIKKCIQYYKNNKNTKWVLLAGDYSTIPSIYASAFVDTYSTMPCDMYYSNFSDISTSDWDYNGNQVYGEVSDSIDMNPQIFVSRLSVETPQQADDVINKIIDYEKGVNYYNRFLLTGGGFPIYDNSSMSYNHYLSELIYSQHVSNNWNGDKYYLYDTGCDLPNGLSLQMSGSNLSSEINRNYAFIHEISHGDLTLWYFDLGDYTSSMASNQTNYPGSVILSGACDTNAFDWGTSLSESFIRNPNGGAIAYFGSSRSGFGLERNDTEDIHYPSGIVYSDLYDAYFYDNLFQTTDSLDLYSFGAVSARAKSCLIEESLSEGVYRYLQFAINPMGDPEMPIYTDNPHSFVKTSGFNINVPHVLIGNNGNLIVNSTENDCTISVLCSDGRKMTKYHVSNALFSGINGICNVAILKHNYVPYYFTGIDTNNSLFGLNLSVYSIDTNNKLVYISTDNDSQDDCIIMMDYDTLSERCWTLSAINSLSGEKPIDNLIVENSSCTINTQGWKKGVYVLRALAGGQVLTKKIIIN